MVIWTVLYCPMCNINESSNAGKSMSNIHESTNTGRSVSNIHESTNTGRSGSNTYESTNVGRSGSNISKSSNTGRGLFTYGHMDSTILSYVLCLASCGQRRVATRGKGGQVHG